MELVDDREPPVGMHIGVRPDHPRGQGGGVTEPEVRGDRAGHLVDHEQLDGRRTDDHVAVGDEQDLRAHVEPAVQRPVIQRVLHRQLGDDVIRRGNAMGTWDHSRNSLDERERPHFRAAPRRDRDSMRRDLQANPQIKPADDCQTL